MSTLFFDSHPDLLVSLFGFVLLFPGHSGSRRGSQGTGVLLALTVGPPTLTLLGPNVFAWETSVKGKGQPGGRFSLATKIRMTILDVWKL